MIDSPDFSQNLFIEVHNGQAIHHPVSGLNLRLFMPDFDFENPPKPFYKFIRKTPPKISPFEIVESLEYENVNDLYFQDKFNIKYLTDVEKADKISSWLENNPKPFDSWSFDESTLNWIPPFPYPNDGGKYFWEEKSLSWITLPNNQQQETGVIEIETLTGNVSVKINGIVNNLTELSALKNPTAGDGYTVSEKRSIYAWNGVKWEFVKSYALSDALIIEADINGIPVKILGVLKDSTELPVSYTGDVGDCYIIDNENLLKAWDGKNWCYTGAIKAY